MSDLDAVPVVKESIAAMISHEARQVEVEEAEKSQLAAEIMADLAPPANKPRFTFG